MYRFGNQKRVARREVSRGALPPRHVVSDANRDAVLRAGSRDADERHRRQARPVTELDAKPCTDLSRRTDIMDTKGTDAENSNRRQSTRAVAGAYTTSVVCELPNVPVTSLTLTLAETVATWARAEPAPQSTQRASASGGVCLSLFVAVRHILRGLAEVLHHGLGCGAHPLKLRAGLLEGLHRGAIGG